MASQSTPSYVCFTWFERDRANLRLEASTGEEIFDLWDEDLRQAIEHGLLTTPKRPKPSSADWLPHALKYASETGLIVRL